MPNSNQESTEQAINDRDANKTKKSVSVLKEHVICSVSYDPAKGLSFEKTHRHSKDLKSFEAPRIILGSSDPFVKKYLELCSPLIALLNSAINGHSFDDKRPKFHNRPNGRPDFKRPVLDENGKQMFTTSAAERLRQDLKTMSANQDLAQAMDLVASGLKELRENELLVTNELKAEKPIVRRIESNPYVTDVATVKTSKRSR
jgi:hypothetical protein